LPVLRRVPDRGGGGGEELDDGQPQTSWDAQPVSNEEKFFQMDAETDEKK